MYNNENVNMLKVVHEKEVYRSKDEVNFGSLTCFGGGVFHKGLAVGMQEKMVPGLIVYDDENFYGFSEKHGFTLLSKNIDTKELEMPRFDSSLENKEKELNIDLTFRDIENFYIKIPNEIERFNIQLIFKINFIYDDESIINKLSLSFINDTQKNVQFVFQNKRLFTKGDSIEENHSSIIQMNTQFINKNFYTCTLDKFT